MSDNGAIVGNYVSKCITFTYGAHEKGTYCYYAPWFYDGKSVTKLGNLWSGTRSTAADINDSLQLTGSDAQRCLDLLWRHDYAYDQRNARCDQ